MSERNKSKNYTLKIPIYKRRFFTRPPNHIQIAAATIQISAGGLGKIIPKMNAIISPRYLRLTLSGSAPVIYPTSRTL